MVSIIVGIAFMTLFVVAGIRVVQPTNLGLVVRFGKYRRHATPGLNWLVPVLDRLVLIHGPGGAEAAVWPRPL